MDNDLLKLFIGSVILLVVFFKAPAELLGLLVKYIGGTITLFVILVFILATVYYLLYRSLVNISEWVWDDVFERHISSGEKITEEDIPHWSKLRLAHATTNMENWLSGDFRWVSYERYYEVMVESLLDE